MHKSEVLKFSFQERSKKKWYKKFALISVWKEKNYTY